LYGIPREILTGDNPQPIQPIEYHDDQRAGFFGLIGFLTISSLDRRTSPSRRGRWIAGNLLCAEPQPPPPNVPMLNDNANGSAEGGGPSTLDVRHALEEHRKNPSCSGCHSLFDPYGLALEQYNAVGIFRSTYDDTTPIDASTSLPGGPTFQGLDGLAQTVATDPRFGECLAKKLFMYGLGRVETDKDEPHLQQAQQQWLAAGQTPSIRRLIQALVATDAFRLRRGGGLRPPVRALGSQLVEAAEMRPRP
jgi:hypothetical protein